MKTKLQVNGLKLDLRLIDQALAQNSLVDFVKQAWPLVEPATPLCWNWHLDAICEYLEASTPDEGINRLIINLPPRSLKSLLVSVLWPAWVWCKRPETRWVFASFSAGLSEKHNSDRRTIVTSHWYQKRWAVRLVADQNQKAEFMNTARGHMLATSVGGSVTGKGGDFIIADDLQNPEMAESALERANVVRFFDETLSTRLDDKRHGRIVVIQQRTHQADLTGHLLAQGGWELLCLPAEFERRTIIWFPRSKRELVKEEGDLLCPEREGRAELDAAKRGLGSYGYASQYLQSPVARGGNLFKESWFGTFRDAPKFDFVLQSWDCAYKTGQTNDYSACVTLGLIQNRQEDSAAAAGLYLLHAWHGKVEFPELERRVKEFYAQQCPHVVLVEDTASGQSLLQQLRSNHYLPVKGVKPDGDKYARAASVTPAFEGGGFFIREGASWSAEYVVELTAFPGGAHDDFVDATVQALAYLREHPEPGILVHYRELAERMRRAQREASLRRPGITAFELARFEREAGYCHKCGVNLFRLSYMTDGPGYLCMDCWNKKDVSPIASTS